MQPVRVGVEGAITFPLATNRTAIQSSRRKADAGRRWRAGLEPQRGRRGPCPAALLPWPGAPRSAPPQPSSRHGLRFSRMPRDTKRRRTPHDLAVEERGRAAAAGGLPWPREAIDLAERTRWP